MSVMAMAIRVHGGGGAVRPTRRNRHPLSRFDGTWLPSLSESESGSPGRRGSPAVTWPAREHGGIIVQHPAGFTGRHGLVRGRKGGRVDAEPGRLPAKYRTGV